jgi:type IV pilus biogenesis/stability protein PilW
MTRTTISLLALAVVAIGCTGANAQKRRKGAEIHHDLAVAALRGGRAQEALREYDEALKLDDRFPEAYLGRGLVYELGFGKLDEAERDYRRAIALKADFPEAHNNLGQLLAKTGRFDEAVREFDVALEDIMYREPYVARCNKGLALLRMGKKDQGRAELQACVSASPRYCNGRRELGNVYLSDGRTKDAVEQYRAYSEVCKVPDAFLRLAQARMKAGDVTGARAAFEECGKLGPETPEGDECVKSLNLLQ